MQGPASIYSAPAFEGVVLTPEASALLAEGSAADTAELNLELLLSAYPVALSPAALALTQGAVTLRAVTVLGRTFVHRLVASDSLLCDFTAVEDAQDGCIRFSATTRASSVPRQYRSKAVVAADPPLFVSQSFGEPAYAQLLEMADQAIVSAGAGVTLTAGAESGAEMGAYSSGLAALRERGLNIKYAEYMPLGLAPVVVHVT